MIFRLVVFIKNTNKQKSTCFLQMLQPVHSKPNKGKKGERAIQRNWTSPRPISTAKLNISRCLHMQPINLVVYKGSYQINLWDI